MKATPDDQALLLVLQAHDTRIAQLAHRASTLPENSELVQLRSESQRLSRELAAHRGGLDDLGTELSRVESDVKTVEARIARDTDRMQSSSSVKDVTAFEQELTSLAKRLNDLEEIELAVMERIETQQGVTDGAASHVAELVEHTVTAQARRDEALAAIEAERLTTSAGRLIVEARIPAELLALYEKQRARYGTGASLLRGGVSEASGVKLLENEMQAIRRADPDDVMMCASSEAILVRTGESGL